RVREVARPLLLAFLRLGLSVLSVADDAVGLERLRAGARPFGAGRARRREYGRGPEGQGDREPGGWAMSHAVLLAVILMRGLGSCRDRAHGNRARWERLLRPAGDGLERAAADLRPARCLVAGGRHGRVVDDPEGDVGRLKVGLLPVGDVA